MIVAFGGFGKAAMVLSSIYILGIICAAVPAGDQRQAVAGLIVTTATRAILRFRAADNRGAEPFMLHGGFQLERLTNTRCKMIGKLCPSSRRKTVSPSM
jgi:hypothetical protein